MLTLEKQQGNTREFASNLVIISVALLHLPWVNMDAEGSDSELIRKRHSVYPGYTPCIRVNSGSLSRLPWVYS